MNRNILFLSHSAQVGGAELCFLDLLKGLRGYRGVVVIPCDGPLKKRIEAVGWEVVVYPIPWWISFQKRSGHHLRGLIIDFPRRLKFLDTLIDRWMIDLVYTNSIACIDGAVAARLRRIPHVWHIHENIGKQQDLKFYLPRFLLPTMVGYLSNRIIVPSSAVGVFFSGNAAKKMRVIHNGIDLRRFRTVISASIRARIGIPDVVKVVSVIGSINENKRQADFVEAAGIVAKCYDDVFFLVVGKGDRAYVDRISEKARELGLEGKFRLLDVQEDVVELMATTDILVSTSLVESFGRTLVEAMAAAKAVISTKNGGAEEIVVNGGTGLLVDPGKPHELASAILSLLQDDGLAVEMGRRGKRRAEELFTLERYVREVEEILSTIS